MGVQRNTGAVEPVERRPGGFAAGWPVSELLRMPAPGQPGPSSWIHQQPGSGLLLEHPHRPLLEDLKFRPVHRPKYGENLAKLNP